MSAPTDLHDLLDRLKPHGWQKAAFPPGLFHRGRTWWIRPVAPGIIELWGAGIGATGPEMALGEVEAYLEKMEAR